MQDFPWWEIYRKKTVLRSCPAQKWIAKCCSIWRIYRRIALLCPYFWTYVVSTFQAITQERRRYGFVLERQTSLAKHNLAFYEKQQVLVEKYMNNWTEIANAREQIPEAVESMFTTNLTVSRGILPEVRMVAPFGLCYPVIFVFVSYSK